MNNYINKSIISILVFIFFFYLILILSTNYFPLNRHWSSIYDNELTIAYNALLFNSGKLQEFTDHSGYFTILFLSIFFKILSFFDFLTIYKISLFNQNNNLDQDLQNIIYFTRLFGMFSASLFCVVAFWTFELFSKNKFLSFILTIILFLSLGTHNHFFQLRNELFSMIFLIMAFYSLSLFFLEKKNYITKYLIFFFLFLFCAILNKAQAFFYLPFILFIIHFIKFEKKVYFNFENYKFLDNKNAIYYLYFFVIFYFLIKLFTGTSSLLSVIFISINVLFINIFFYFHLKKSGADINQNLKIINFLLLVSFIVFKFILSAHPSTNETAFNNTFTDIIDNTFKYTNTYKDGNQFGFLILDTLISFKEQIFIIFSTLNYYSFLIITSILLNFFNKKNKKLIFFNLSCIVSFFLIMSINGLRNNNVSFYYIFCDFFLILSFASYINILNKKFFLLFIPILVIIFSLNYPLIKSIKPPQENIRAICNDTYFYDWHKNIAPTKFKDFCNNNL